MRFVVDFDQGAQRRSVMRVLEVFLNEHLISESHGTGFEALFVEFVPAKPGKKYRRRLAGGRHAEIELPLPAASKEDGAQLDVLRQAFEAMFEAVRLAGELPLAQGEFREQELLQAMAGLRSALPGDEEQLAQYLARCDAIEQGNRVKRALMEQRARQANPRPCTTRLQGVRIYRLGACGALALPIAPYAEVYSNLLRRAGLLTPGYVEVYIQLAPTLEEALCRRALEPWHECTPAALDVEAFAAAPAERRMALFADACGEALRAIARIDGLDGGIVERVVRSVAEQGIDRELVALTQENERHLAEVLYNPSRIDAGQRVPYRLRVTCRTTGRSGSVELAPRDMWNAVHSLGALLLSRREVRIKARSSFRASLTLDSQQLPSEVRFAIEDVLEGRATNP